MSYSNETTYYGLPLPTGSDKSTFTDNNTAFEAIDGALHSAAEGAATAAEDITALKGRMSDAEEDIDNLETDLGTEKGKIVALQNKETLQDGEIADVRSDCEGMICAYNEPSSTSTHAYSEGDYFIYNDVLYVATASIAVGATIVPDTNCETTDVATVLKSQAGKVGDLSDLTTTDKSSAVAAINEVKSDLGEVSDALPGLKQNDELTGVFFAGKGTIDFNNSTSATNTVLISSLLTQYDCTIIRSFVATVNSQSDINIVRDDTNVVGIASSSITGSVTFDFLIVMR